jgi:hypothetical protein
VPTILEKSVLFILYYERNWYFISKFIKINEESRKWRNFQRLAQSLASFCCKNPACDVLLLLSALIVVPAYIFSVNTENLLVKLRVVLSFYFEIVWESLQSFCLVLMINFDMNLIWLQIPLRLKILKISFKNVFIMKLPRTLSYNG